MRGDIDKKIRSAINLERVLDKCKKTRLCPYCGAKNGTVKKLTGAFKIIHEDRKPTQEDLDSFRDEFSIAMQVNEEIKQHIHKATHDLDPLTVLHLFKKVIDGDCPLLNMNRERGRPEDMLIQTLAVPPACIRPSVTMGSSGSNEDDLTVKIGDIVYINNYIKAAFDKGASTAIIMENWDFLQQQIAMLINADLPGFPKVGPQAKPIRALSQRLKGKTGRFRGNLSGKRVDFSSRTVISPDPNLRVDQVGVPRRVAKILTYPERVTKHNLQRLRQAIINGPDVHPGANIIAFASGTKIFLKYGDRSYIASMLRPGDVVERHLRDDDIVLFNRQPSLHKMSIMSHRAKVLDWRTFRFNECVCSPYNADFDGDEMNMHLPQTEEARTEALNLMGIHENLVTPRHGQPLVHPTQDFLTSSFLVTHKDVFMDKNEFCWIVSYFNNASERVELPPPAIFKPIKLWTGKQLFSMLLKPNNDACWPLINLSLPESNYDKVGSQEQMCCNDGFVTIRSSQLMCGGIGKKTLGGSNMGLMFALIRDHSSKVASVFMNRLSKFSARWIGTRGFSIGIDDVTPSKSLNKLKMQLLNDGYRTCYQNINKWKKGDLEEQAGCNAEETLESTLLGSLSQIREDAGMSCLRNLDRNYNSPLIMAVCGSKGSKINISQMVACVGQQAVGGSRIANGFVNRTLPHFDKFSRLPQAKGFVENSFFTGLTATEFFFHTMGGREGLVDTAVKTAETGYMQRRLVKALEDLCVQYDGSVRNAEQTIVQLRYGDDGLDPVMMAEGINPVNLSRVWEHVRAVYAPNSDLSPSASPYTTRIPIQTYATSTSTNASVKREQERHKEEASACAHEPVLPCNLRVMAGQAVKLKVLRKCSSRFKESIKEFLCKEADKLEVQMKKLQLKTTDRRARIKKEKEMREEVARRLKAREQRKMRKQKAKERRKKQREKQRKINKRKKKKIVIETSEEEESESEEEISYEVLVEEERKKDESIETWVVSKALAATIMRQINPITKKHVDAFINACVTKYNRSLMEPGTAVGAIAAQSIGEPGTQMTLKTFHFAGVASMNVTLGVPRIKEIINAAKNISSPIIQAPLVNNKDVKAARIVKGRLEQTKLGDIAEYIEQVLAPGQCYLSVKLDLEACEALQLNLDSGSVATSLLASKLLRLKGGVKCKGKDQLRIYSPDGSKETMLYSMQALKDKLPHVIVAGIPDINRAVISDNGDNTFKLIIEGSNLLHVMGTLGLKGEQTISNHVIEVEKILGIEAARRTIMKEIHDTMDGHGLTVDPRHVALLADVMSYRGEILGITRFGIAKMKESVLMLASFEKTADHLFEAALRGSQDNVAGVSECIIMGCPMPVGTGLFSLMQKIKQAPPLLKAPGFSSPFKKSSLLLYNQDRHLDITSSA